MVQSTITLRQLQSSSAGIHVLHDSPRSTSDTLMEIKQNPIFDFVMNLSLVLRSKHVSLRQILDIV